jgi:hypothetical protein
VYHSQMPPSILFTVTTAIANAAPVRTAVVQINDYQTNTIFNLRVILLNGGVLSTVRLYGALSLTGFPAVGTPAEALWQYDGVPALAINEGVLRIPMAKRQDGAPAGGACDQVRIMPNFLVAEWTNTAPAGNLTFEIWISSLGPVPQGVE